MSIGFEIFNNVKFDKSRYRYTLNGQVLTSVSRLLGQIKPPFESEKIAKMVASREGKTPEEVLQEWEIKKNRSLARGRLVHKRIAQILADPGQEQVDASDRFTVLNKNADLPEVEAFRQFVDYSGIKALEVEKIVGDEYMGMAGQIDAVLSDTAAPTGLLTLWDWKTGGKFETDNPWGRTMLPPFEDLPDCELVNYSLQLSLYWLIVERNVRKYQVENAYILHLTEGAQYFVYPIYDYRKRLLEWIHSLREINKYFNSPSP